MVLARPSFQKQSASKAEKKDQQEGARKNNLAGLKKERQKSSWISVPAGSDVTHNYRPRHSRKFVAVRSPLFMGE